jgi:hypothetical protein
MTSPVNKPNLPNAVNNADMANLRKMSNIATWPTSRKGQLSQRDRPRRAVTAGPSLFLSRSRQIRERQLVQNVGLFLSRFRTYCQYLSGWHFLPIRNLGGKGRREAIKKGVSRLPRAWPFGCEFASALPGPYRRLRASSGTPLPPRSQRAIGTFSTGAGCEQRHVAGGEAGKLACCPRFPPATPSLKALVHLGG